MKFSTFITVLITTIAVIYYYVFNRYTQKRESIDIEMSTSGRLPVVIVGTGLAGLSSAYKLLEKKIPVVLIDKLDKFGGNSIKASSGINGIESSTQMNNGVKDSFDEFLQDTSKSGGELGNNELQRKLVKDSKEAIRWLQQDIGIPLDLVNRLGGHSQRRTHRSSNIPPGFEIISKLKNKVMEHEENLQLLLSSKLIDIDVSSTGKLVGLKVLNLTTQEEHYIQTDNLILATGGFGYSEELLKKYRPDLIGYPTTNGAQTLGEGQVLLEKVGAQLIDMDQVQVHPTGFINPNDPESRWKFLAAESLRGIGGVLLNVDKFERFVDELTTRDKVTDAILKQQDRKALLVLNEDMYQDFKFQLDFYIKQGLVKTGTVEEHFGDSSDKIVELFNDYSDESKPDSFGRDFKAHKYQDLTKESPLFVAQITPVVHFTMGGVKINQEGQVMNKSGDVIEGLYAVGEVSGGVHGKNRLGGNSLLECVVFGSSAASSVALKYKL